jgi:hypothetical protein
MSWESQKDYWAKAAANEEADRAFRATLEQQVREEVKRQIRPLLDRIQKLEDDFLKSGDPQ